MKWLTILLLVVFLSTGCKHSKLIKQGDALYERGEYSAALQRYRAAQQRKPNSKKIAQRIEVAEERLLDDILIRTREALAAEAYTEAIGYATLGLREFPRERVIHQNVDTVIQRVSRVADEHQGLGYFASALYLYQTLNQNFVGHEKALEPRITEIRQSWSAELVSRAETAAEAGHSARGFLLWAKAHELVPGNDKRQRRDALRADVLARHAYRVDFAVPPRASAGTRAIAALVLDTPFPTGLLLNAEGPQGPEATSEPGASIRLTAQTPRFERTQHQRTESVEYQSGVRRMRNAEHSEKRKEVGSKKSEIQASEAELLIHEGAVRRYEVLVAREGVTDSETEAKRGLAMAKERRDETTRTLQTQRDELAQLEGELAELPTTIEEPIFATHTFPITTHQVIARLPISGSITGRDNRDTKPFETTVELVYEDDAYAAQPVIELEQKALALPSQADMTTALHGEGASHVIYHLMESFDGYRWRLIEESARLNDPSQRVDLMVTYMLLDTERMDEGVLYDVVELEDIPNAMDFF